jgi:hypothetical protein
LRMAANRSGLAGSSTITAETISLRHRNEMDDLSRSDLHIRFRRHTGCMFEDGSDRSFQAEGIPSMLIEVASGTQ